MKEIKIKSVKLLKNGEKVEISYKETHPDKSHSTTSKEWDMPPHPDFIGAVESLAPHLAILTDYTTEKGLKKYPELENFVATGYSIGGKDDDSLGFTIKGYRKTIQGGTVTLNTPFQKFEQSDENKYSLLEELQGTIERIEFEVNEYLFSGKRADKPQTEMKFEEHEN